MLEMEGAAFSSCDGVSRRSFLRVGFLGLGGLTLPQLLAQRARAAEAGEPSRKTSVIYIELAPGAYTAIVAGVGGATGVGIVEVYELDGR